MMVLQAIYTNDWFFGQELQFAIGASASLPNLFAFGGGYFSPYIYANTGKG